MFIELIYNAALLVTLSVLYGLLSYFRKINIFIYKGLVGLLFGFIAIAGMSMPVHYSTGVIYDGRSVILVLAGLFGGGLSGTIAVFLAAFFRIYLGGAGTLAGIATIVVSCSVGLGFRYYIRKETYRINLFMIWVIGFIAHVLMLTAQLLIPWPLAFEVIRNIWFPILIIFPLATLLIGILIRSEEKRIVDAEKIEQSERLFQTLSENSPVGIFRTRADGYTTYVNTKWCQLSGVSAEKAIGDGWLSAVHPDDREKLIKNWNSSVENNSGSVAEYRFLRDDGQIVWVYGEALPEYSDTGKIVGYVGTISDMTERKNYEKALAQSEENYRRSLDESPMGVRIISRDGNTLYANATMLKIFGSKDFNEFINCRFADLYTEESLRDHIIRKEKRIYGYYTPAEYEIEINNRKNEVRNLMVFRKEIIWNGSVCYQNIYRDITKQKIAERALRESEESLKEAEQIAGLGNWKFDLITKKVTWSENCYRIHGFEPCEIEPDTEFIKSRVHPEDVEQIDLTNEKLAKYDNPFEIEIRIRLKNGQYKWIHNRIIPHFEDGQLVMFRGVVMDINELKAATKALKESEQNYRSLFENHAAVKLMIDATNGDIVNANQAAAEFYGWTVEQLQKMNISQINTLEQEELNAEFSKAKFQKNVFFEFKHRLADGSVRNVDVFSSKIMFQGKECLHSIVHDVTQRKEVEEKLKLLSKSIEQSPISILITDSTGIIEYVNPKFSEVSGYEVDELVGKSPGILKSGNHSDEFYINMWETIQAGNDWIGEIQNKKKNGELYWESEIISPILDASGKISNFISLKEDITERKRMIREVVEAKEKAEESERLKSAFLANMSHEIRTPLNAILGFTQLLTLDEEIRQEQKIEFTSIINKNADRLLQIISDILDISRLETGLLKMYKREIDVHDLFSELYSQCKLKLNDVKKSTIELKMEVPAETILLYSDHVRLVQIMMNLLNNAIKFTDEGSISFGVFHADEEKVGFFVSDTGIGIDPSIQSTIFERFRQADDSPSRTYGGNGLGLAIVKSLTELLGGEIQMESEPGKGTTFSFYIPRNQGE